VQFEQLVRLKPEYAEGYHLLGSTYLDTNQPELAAQQFADAAELDPRSPTVFNSMGVALAQLGMLREAEICFAKAVELDPEFVDARINLDRARSEQQLAP
jgi:tetratricopeptide (TPR) repeat protein